MKTKGKVNAEASQNRMSNQTTINKGQNMKSPSSVKSNLEKLDTKSMTKKSKERNLDSVRSKGEKSGKRKKEEEEKKPKSNSIKSPTPEAKRRKVTKLEPEKKNSAKPATKKPSTGTATQSSVKRGNTSSKSDQGKKKKQKESRTHEKLEPKSPNSKVEARAKNYDSLSVKAAPSRSKGQTQIATLKKPRLSSLTSLVEKSRELSLRRLKIMRALGLIPPAASPFIRTGARL